LPTYAWPHFIAAVFTAAAFLLLTVKLVIPAAIAGAIAIGAVLAWVWELDRGPSHPPVEIGGGIRLPVYVTGSSSHAWWAMVILMLVSGSLYASAVFSYLYLWTVSPEVWPERNALPSATNAFAGAVLLVASSGAVAYASRAVRRSATGLACLALTAAVPLIALACAIEIAAHARAGISPVQSSYGAIVYTIAGIEAFFAVVVILMALYSVARARAGLLNRTRRVTFDNTMLLWHYTVAQGVVGLVLVHGFPRLLG
jgi:cytochrome c oxidase subunit I+III